MQRREALRLMAGMPAAALATGWSLPVQAQVSRGFDQQLAAVANGDEIQRQPDLWVFEISFKPMRMIWVDTTDPKTGEVSRDQIWYLAYRTINRSIAARADDTNTTPVNELDPLPGKNLFIPEFMLMTFDQPGSDIPSLVQLDEVIPQAVAQVNEIERRRTTEPLFLNSVDIVQPLPDPVPVDAENPDWIYGVATWMNVDPETDFFSITMRGFSNGYEVRQGPGGEPVIWRKSIVQRFTRRGDRFEPSQREFEFDGPPQWVYLPDPTSGNPAIPSST